MSGSDPRVRLAVLCVAAAALAIAALPQMARARAAAPPENVPRFLAEAAALSVADLAYGLAEVRASAGFVVLEGDAIESAHGAQTPWHTRRRDDAKLIPLEDALDVFRTAHPGYEVLSTSGFIRVRARAISTASSLFTKKTSHVRIHTLPLPSAINRAMRVVDSDIPIADGMVGNMVSDGPPPAVADLPKVSVDLNQATFLDVLDEIAGQAPGTVWVLSQHGTTQHSTYTLAVRIPNGRYILFHEKLGAR